MPIRSCSLIGSLLCVVWSAHNFMCTVGRGDACMCMCICMCISAMTFAGAVNIVDIDGHTCFVGQVPQDARGRQSPTQQLAAGSVDDVHVRYDSNFRARPLCKGLGTVGNHHGSFIHSQWPHFCHDRHLVQRSIAVQVRRKHVCMVVGHCRCCC